MIDLADVAARQAAEVDAQAKQLRVWQPNLVASLNSVSALAALNELRPGGALMKVDTAVQLKLSVPEEVQKELKNVYLAGNELLRHFWSCFPVTTERLESKLVEMKNTLEKFKFNKLQPLQQKLTKEHFNPDVSLTSLTLCSHTYSMPIMCQLSCCSWQIT